MEVLPETGDVVNRLHGDLGKVRNFFKTLEGGNDSIKTEEAVKNTFETLEIVGYYHSCETKKIFFYLNSVKESLKTNL